MQDDRFQTWHYLPLHLTGEEIANPLLVIERFFNISRIGGQLKLLKKWRRYVIHNDYYRGANGHPNDLLFVHLEAVRLIEAAFLINQIQLKVISDLAGDKEVTAETNEPNDRQEYSTKFLSQKDIADPVRVIRKLCKDRSLPEYREHLQNWLIYGLSTQSCGEFILTGDLIPIYDLLGKLTEACWLIHIRSSGSAAS